MPHPQKVLAARDLVGEIDAGDIVDGTITPIKLSGAYRSIAADGALAIAATDGVIECLSTTTGAKSCTMTATHAGHRVSIRVTAATGGSYTVVASGTTFTLDAAGDNLDIVYSGSAWRVVRTQIA